MEEKATYDINFFKPHTEFLKDNIRLIMISVVIWAIAVFGFQLLLKVMETPTPEPGYLTYQQVWEKKQSATNEDKQELAKVYLTLVGKYIPLRSNDAVKQSFTAIVHELLPADKTGDAKAIATALNIEGQLLEKSIPFALADSLGSEDVSSQIPPIMDKYLIHNQSVLTDTKFLGFPLHYFYTAVFLKILFVMICLVYCLAIDKIMKKHGLETAND